MKTFRPVLVVVVIVLAFSLWMANRPGGSRPALFGPPEKIAITEGNGGGAPLDSEEQVNISVYKKALPSVVNITATALVPNFFYGLMPQPGQGTGFILNKEGHILTNYHVIGTVVQARRGDVKVTLSNRRKPYPAQIVGVDPTHDLAVLKIDAPDLTPAVLGDSRTLQVGQKVYAIGNPFGLTGTMTRGIVSSIRPVDAGDGYRIDDAIQTDAAINPGNSGGPLLNSRGEVVGINSMIMSASGSSAGVGFAIPINTAKAVLNDLITTGTVRRPSLGVAAALPIGPELADDLGLAADYGVLIVELVRGGPAERAGLRGGTERAIIGNTQIRLGGDLIVGIDGEDVETVQDVAMVMNRHRAGDTVTVTVYRGRKKMDVKVTLGEARGAS